MAYTMVVVVPNVAMPKKTTMQKSTGPSWAVFPNSFHLVMTGISWERVASVPCTMTPPGRLAINPSPHRSYFEAGSFGEIWCVAVHDHHRQKVNKGERGGPGTLNRPSLYHRVRGLSTENGRPRGSGRTPPLTPPLNLANDRLLL